jgi:hypothetical protein
MVIRTSDTHRIQGLSTMRPLITAACLLTVTLAAGGCAIFPQTTSEEACAELPSSVWPWQPIQNARIDHLPDAGSPGLFPTRIIQVSGTIEQSAQFREPVQAKFECVFRGNELKSFAWIEPAQFVTPYTD